MCPLLGLSGLWTGLAVASLPDPKQPFQKKETQRVFWFDSVELATDAERTFDLNVIY